MRVGLSVCSVNVMQIGDRAAWMCKGIASVSKTGLMGNIGKRPDRETSKRMSNGTSSNREGKNHFALLISFIRPGKTVYQLGVSDPLPEVQNLPPNRRVCSPGEILEKFPHLGKVVNQEVLA